MDKHWQTVLASAGYDELQSIKEMRELAMDKQLGVNCKHSCRWNCTQQNTFLFEYVISQNHSYFELLTQNAELEVM